MSKFLVYLDILGFENLPQIIAKQTGIDQNTVREKFLSEPLHNAISELISNENMSNGISSIEGSDNYILECGDKEKLFQTYLEK